MNFPLSNFLALLQDSLADGVLTLTLNRPEALNSVTEMLARMLQVQLDRADADPNVRAVVLTGAGKAFCTGQDLRELTGPDAPPMEQILSEHFNPIVLKIRACAKPVVAAVNGVAAGAGANIALACDVVLASERASFIQAFTKVGLIPDSGGTWMLPRIVGFQKASALMMTGDKLSAGDAERLGMVYRVVGADELEDAAAALAHQLARMPTKALALAKQALELGATQTLEQQLDTEDQLQRIAAETADFKEGVAAFVGKRKPKFIGA